MPTYNCNVTVSIDLDNDGAHICTATVSYPDDTGACVVHDFRDFGEGPVFGAESLNPNTMITFPPDGDAGYVDPVEGNQFANVTLGVVFLGYQYTVRG